MTNSQQHLAGCFSAAVTLENAGKAEQTALAWLQSSTRGHAAGQCHRLQAETLQPADCTVGKGVKAVSLLEEARQRVAAASHWPDWPDWPHWPHWLPTSVGVSRVQRPWSGSLPLFCQREIFLSETVQPVKGFF